MPFRKTLTKVRVVTRNCNETFNTFQEAKEVYPELDMYRGSKNFTSALEDNDCLLFEDWETHNAFNED